MSVINQALKDLEQRCEQQQAPPIGQLNAIVLPRSRTKLIAVFTVAGVLILVSGLWVWQSGWLSTVLPSAESAPRSLPQLMPQPQPKAEQSRSAPLEQPLLTDAVERQQLPEPLNELNIEQPPSTNTARLKSKPQTLITAAPTPIPIPIPIPAPISQPLLAEPAVIAKKTSAQLQRTTSTESAKSTANQLPDSQLTIELVELTATETATLLFKQGKGQAERGLTFKAQDSWLAALQALPAHHQARESLALSYLNQNNFISALDMLTSGNNQFPHQQQFKLLAAKIYIYNQQPEQALQILDQPYRSSNADNSVIDLAGAMAQQLKLWPQAEYNYAALVARDSSNAKWLMGLAIALDAQGKSAAIARYNQLLMLIDIEPVLNDYARQRLAILQSQ